MAFLESRLDARIERGARGGPTNRGRFKVYTGSGKLKQDFRWAAPLQTWDVSHGIKSLADYEALRAMWYVVNFTPYEGFRFRDWSDFEATRTNTALTLITGATWQLQRAYTFGAATFKRNISKPNAGVVVYDAGGSVLVATVDTATGIATVTGTPASWTGTFDVPVTFADDEWSAELESGPGGPQIITQPIRLEEVRL